MDWSLAIAMSLILLFVVDLTIRGIIRRRREKPSDFAAGIARSLNSNASDWDFDTGENWIMSHKASIAVSLQSGNYGQVNTTQHVNSGTQKIAQFEGADRRAFTTAIIEWRERTAIERTHIAERRKRDALQALAAA